MVNAPGRRPSTRELRTEIFDEAVGIVDADYARRLTVDEVARRVATSPRQLYRAFSEIGGLSFRAYLTSVRMARAAELLERTDLPVNEVGRRVGYRAASQFTKAFKRAYGATPSELRAQSRGRSPRPSGGDRWLHSANSYGDARRAGPSG